MSLSELVARNSRRGDHGADLAALPAPPSMHTSIVTCMDARMDMFDLFGLQPGEAHVIRNAGGIVTDDVIRSLSISQHRLGTDQILLAQHSGCGMGTITDDGYRQELLAHSGLTPTWAVEAFTDVDASVRVGLARIRTSPFLKPGSVVRGFVVELDDGGVLREIS